VDDRKAAPVTREANRVITADQRAVKGVALIVAPLIGGLAALGGLGSFATVRQAARPYFGHLAWIVPVGMDVGILILLAWDLLMAYLDLVWPVLRWVAWAYIAATIAVNVGAAHGDLAGGVMHAAMPVLFITVVEGVRHLVRQRVGLASGRRREPIPVARWLLAPLSSGLLWRRMVLWNVTVYHHGLRLEYEHLLAVSGLQQRYGRWAWRWKAPLAERLALRLQPAQTSLTRAYDSATGDPQGYDQEPYGRGCLGAGPLADELFEAARRFLADADRQGVRLSNAQLARRLRAAGYAIANGRIGELADAVRESACSTRGKA
jgi:Protein of unknown function (DUF2637)